MEMLPLCPRGLQSYPTSSQLVRGGSTKREKQPKSVLAMEKLEAQRERLAQDYHEVEAALGLRHQLELCLPRSRARAWQAQVCWSASRGPRCRL